MAYQLLLGDSREVLKSLPAESIHCVITSPPSAETLAYLAGIIDADGYIGVRRSTYAVRIRKDSTQPVYSERVAVKQVEPHAIELLRELFGGTKYLQGPSAKKGRRLYTWQATNVRAYKCLRALRPHLRIKAARADNAIALRAIIEESRRARVSFGRGHQGADIRPAELGRRMEECYQEAKRLNSVGTGGGERGDG